MSKPSVIILGGVGFIGRNLVQYLVEKDLCSRIRVVDKGLPATSFLGKVHADAFSHPNVEFMQGNLTAPASIARVFNDKDAKFDFCINLSSTDLPYGQTEAVYEEKVLDLARKCVDEAKRHGVKKWIQVSTAQVYEPKKGPHKEDGKIEPWTNLAKFSLLAEEAVIKSGVPAVVLRPATVYGPGDIAGISPRLIVAAVYKHLGKKMSFLWGSELKINTVHVFDVSAAIWVALTKANPGSIYNLADKSDTDQGSLNKFLEDIFGIKTGFKGKAISAIAKTQMSAVVEAVNDKHLKPWSEVCKQHGINNTPLTPYLDQELLYNTNLSIDGSAIEKIGFKYERPQLSEASLREQIAYFSDQGLYPKI